MKKSEIFDSIRNRIIEQDLKPGQILKEKELMQHYNVGRTPLRDIFMSLEKDGLISVIPRYGTFVSELTLNDIINSHELRIHLEALVMDILCKRMTVSQFDTIKKELERMEHAYNSVASAEISQQDCQALLILFGDFHLQTYMATENRYLIETLRKLHGNSMRMRGHLGYSHNLVLDELEDHRKLCDALAEKNAEACKEIISQHIMNFSNICIALT